MTKKSMLCVAALSLALFAGSAEAGKGGGKGGGGSTGGGGGVSTNYGCKTMAAGTILTSATGPVSLTQSTWVCYLCNTTTRVCTVNSPASLVGLTFRY